MDRETCFRDRVIQPKWSRGQINRARHGALINAANKYRWLRKNFAVAKSRVTHSFARATLDRVRELIPVSRVRELILSLCNILQSAISARLERKSHGADWPAMTTARGPLLINWRTRATPIAVCIRHSCGVDFVVSLCVQARAASQPARPNGTWCDGDIFRAAREKHNASALALRIYCDILRSSDGSFGS